jgi:hypothetical protein
MHHGEKEIVSAQSHTIASEALFTGSPNFFREEKSYIQRPYVRGRSHRGWNNTMETVPKYQLGKQYKC